MIYVVLDTAELQLERIRVRVSQGGHDVPADKVQSRRVRSFEQLAWFAGKVDQCLIFNNSTGEPELAVARVARGPLWRFSSLQADLVSSLLAGDVDLRDATDLDLARSR